jgi:cyclopropane fatty-acyl-phospholipid synthase-like methyltransferase
VALRATVDEHLTALEALRDEMRDQASAETEGDSEAQAYARLMRQWAKRLDALLQGAGREGDAT